MASLILDVGPIGLKSSLEFRLLNWMEVEPLSICIRGPFTAGHRRLPSSNMDTIVSLVRVCTTIRFIVDLKHSNFAVNQDQDNSILAVDDNAGVRSDSDSDGDPFKGRLDEIFGRIPTKRNDGALGDSFQATPWLKAFPHKSAWRKSSSVDTAVRGLATLGKIDFVPFSATSANKTSSYSACHGFGKIRNASEDSGSWKIVKRRQWYSQYIEHLSVDVRINRIRQESFLRSGLLPIHRRSAFEAFSPQTR
ncbi:hypothetical protein DFH07DRAFT_781579 [Mycena maculata]|uniref:Uncharacterized protein n=1 Tax=Mycena maculata TaxID=230809 RepID=A0AAD7HXI7_9AGAR|nr:hypothetical protein DFH07DRAFT_781579 [Mycena maculata]